MNKTELIAAVAEQSGLSKKDAEKVVTQEQVNQSKFLLQRFLHSRQARALRM